MGETFPGNQILGERKGPWMNGSSKNFRKIRNRKSTYSIPTLKYGVFPSQDLGRKK